MSHIFCPPDRQQARVIEIRRRWQASFTQQYQLLPLIDGPLAALRRPCARKQKTGADAPTVSMNGASVFWLARGRSAASPSPSGQFA